MNENFWQYIGPISGLVALALTIVRTIWDRGAQMNKTLREERDDFRQRWLNERLTREDAERDADRWRRRYERCDDELERVTGRRLQHRDGDNDRK